MPPSVSARTGLRSHADAWSHVEYDITFILGSPEVWNGLDWVIESHMSKKSRGVFLSYSGADRGVARKIAEHLREAGVQVWDPEYEILPGSDWSSLLKRALNSAEALVVLISPEAMDSRSVSQEIEYALTAKHLRGRLIPVVIRPTKDAPWILKTLPSVRYQSPRKAGKQILELRSAG